MKTTTPLIERLLELSQPAEPEPVDSLCRYLAEATHRCEIFLGYQPVNWGIPLQGILADDHLTPSRSAGVTAFLTSLPWSQLRFFLDAYATWEELGRTAPNPFEPLVEICRHGGSMRRAGDGLLDLEDHGGVRVGIPIASTFRKEFRKITP